DDHGAIAFSPDGERFAADYPDGTVRVYSAASGEELRRYTVGLPLSEWGLSWDPAGARLLLVAPEGLRWLDLESGRVDRVKRPTPAALELAAWRPDGREVALTGADEIRLWDAAKGGTRRVLAVTGKRGVWVRFSPSGERLLSSDWGGLWMLWDARSGRNLLTM